MRAKPSSTPGHWIATDSPRARCAATRRDATLRNLELLGEAATHIPPQVRASHPHLPWRQVIATRNRLIHAYLGIDDDVNWSIVRDDLPALLEGLQSLRGALDSAA